MAAPAFAGCRPNFNGLLQKGRIVDLKLEVLILPVPDVDRSKHFYESLGFRLDVARRV
ncbi:hypothetical protein [Saccharopolyspora soli]|uniref:hypothetical protein n=1 Tax=Saccharopolyspora soli TaxID=2926618 RepID=UPI003556FD3C